MLQAYIVIAYIVMTYIVVAYILMAYIVMAYIVMAYIVVAYIFMAYIVSARIALARFSPTYLRAFLAAVLGLPSHPAAALLRSRAARLAASAPAAPRRDRTGDGARLGVARRR